MNMSATETTSAGTDVQDEIAQGVAAAQAGDKSSAHEIFQSLAAGNAHMPEVWVWLGGTSANLEEAESAFQRAAMLDPSNEEARLGLRWVALRRQIMGQTGATDLSTGIFDSSSSATAGLHSGSLTSSTGGDLSSGSLTAATGQSADSGKAAKVKVGKAGGRRLNIPIAAIVLFALSIVLYGIVAWFLIFQH